METVAFYSYKGGVGRTLLVANAATLLAMSGRRVVAMDLDLEAPGLHYKLGTRELRDRARAGTLPGVVDLLLGVLTNEVGSPGIDAAVVTLELPGAATGGALMVLPAGSAPARMYWNALERLNSSVRSPRRHGGLVEAVLELQARIAENLRPDILLIDSRTGITELGGLATSMLADRVVCLTTLSPESIEGTLIVAEALRTAPRLESKGPLRPEFLVTRVPVGFAGSPTVARLIGELGGEATVLPHDSGIARQERVFFGSGVSTGSEATQATEEGLEAATLKWIASAFPGHQQDTQQAVERLAVVDELWRELQLGGDPHRSEWLIKQVLDTNAGSPADGGERRDPSEQALTMDKIAGLLRMRGDLDGALRIWQEGVLPIYEKLGDARSKAVTMGRIADVLQVRGELDGALRIRREEELPVFEKLGDVRGKAVTMGKIADVLQARGDLDGALRIRREEELPVFEKLGDVQAKAVAMGKIADVLQARGDLDGALRIRREEQLPVYEKLGDVRAKAVTMGKIADVLQARGDLDGALCIRREEELPVYEKLGDVREKALAMGKIADVLQARGDLDGALRIRREEELPVYEKLGDVREKALTMARIAGIELARGRVDEAIRGYESDVIPALEMLGAERDLAQIQWNLAVMLRRRGRPEDLARAEALTAQAYEAARRMGLPLAEKIERA